MSTAASRRDFLKTTGALALFASVGTTVQAGPAQAATAIVVRKSGTPRPLTPTFFGLNGNNTQEGLAWDRVDLGTALTSLRPGVLRYPGGTIGNYWDWRAGWFQPNGPWPGQTNGQGGQVITPFDNSLTPYKVALQRSGAEALFMVNMLSIDGRLATDADNARLIQDQVQFLQSAATAGINVKRVELGNEFYLPGNGAGANANDNTTRFPTAGDYARQANAWVTALRTAFPAVQIAAVGADAAGNNAARREGWNAEVLAGLTGANALTLHPYIQVQDATASPQSLLSMPYARVQSLIATEFPQLASHGLGAWVTEFNMVDKTPDLTFAGTWAHGLFVGAYALLLAQNSTVTLVDLHNAVGDAVAGVLFDSTDGFRTPTPVTQFLGRSAMGATYAALLQATKASTTAQALTFPAGPVLEGGAPGVVGMDFSGGGQHQVVVVNLAEAAVTLNVASLFSGSFHWSRTTAASLSTRITGASAVTVKNGTASRKLSVPSHSIVRIFR